MTPAPARLQNSPERAAFFLGKELIQLKNNKRVQQVCFSYKLIFA
jgi:hypothetical protein